MLKGTIWTPTYCFEVQEVGNPNRERDGGPVSQQQTLHLQVHDHGCAALNIFQLCGVSRKYWCEGPRLYGVPDSCTARPHIPCSCSFLNSFPPTSLSLASQLSKTARKNTNCPFESYRGPAACSVYD